MDVNHIYQINYSLSNGTSILAQPCKNTLLLEGTSLDIFLNGS